MSPSRKPISKAEKSLALVCLLVVVPLAGIVYLYGGRDAEPNWNIPPATPRPNPNGYDFYVAAARATVRFTPEIDAASDVNRGSNSLSSPYALQNYSLVRRQLWLKANAATFALVDKGLKTPSMAPAYSGKPMSDWSSLRQLARDIGARSRTFQMAKQPMNATMTALDGMQMGLDSTRGGGLLARLVGVAIVAIGHQPLDDWNKTVNALSADEARTAARRLEGMMSRDQSSVQTLTNAKRDGLIDLQRIFASDGWRTMIVAKGTAGIGRNVLSFWRAQITSKRTLYEEVNRALDAEIASAKLPYSKSQIVTPLANVDAFTSNFVVSGKRMRQNEARHAISNSMLLLRLALRAYIAEHRKAPPTLAALVPSYLKRIPTDAYNDGKPLFYVPQGKTYKLWSVGPDMINNGGVPFARRPGVKTTYPVQSNLDSAGDFVAGLCR